jgi:hypothetical protein
MRSFATLITFAIAAISLTAAAPTPVAELNARRKSPGRGSFGSFGGAGGFNPAAAFEGIISKEIEQLEGATSAIASFEANPTVSAAVASASAIAASVASEASAAASSLPSVAARQSDDEEEAPEPTAAAKRQFSGGFHGPFGRVPGLPFGLPGFGAAPPSVSAAASAAPAAATAAKRQLPGAFSGFINFPEVYPPGDPGFRHRPSASAASAAASSVYYP